MITPLELFEDYDWKHALGEALHHEYVSSDTDPAVLIEAAGIKSVIAVSEGEKDVSSWVGLFVSESNGVIFLEAHCDYTGWDCQAGGSIKAYVDLHNAILRGMDDGDRERLLPQLQLLGFPTPAPRKCGLPDLFQALKWIGSHPNSWIWVSPAGYDGTGQMICMKPGRTPEFTPSWGPWDLLLITNEKDVLVQMIKLGRGEHHRIIPEMDWALMWIQGPPGATGPKGTDCGPQSLGSLGPAVQGPVTYVLKDVPPPGPDPFSQVLGLLTMKSLGLVGE